MGLAVIGSGDYMDQAVIRVRRCTCRYGSGGSQRSTCAGRYPAGAVLSGDAATVAADEELKASGTRSLRPQALVA